MDAGMDTGGNAAENFTPIHLLNNAQRFGTERLAELGKRVMGETC